MSLVRELDRRILVLDGSMGALLQARGLPPGMAPDVWMMSNPQIIEAAHREYAQAGADILITNTFGASKWRLEEYQSYGQIREINAKAVDLARKAADGKAFVVGDIGPSGETIFPTGSKSFDEVWEIFFEQAKILVELGVDGIIVETMFDSLELRCALSAIRAVSLDVPILAHATFNTDGITDTGATPENIVAIAEGFHCTTVGINCSTGPEPMIGVVERMSKLSRLPVSVQPNAGLPKSQGGKTVFPMTAEDLKPFVSRFVDAGARIIGGCCGTTPTYIRYVKEGVRALAPKVTAGSQRNPRIIVSSLSQITTLGSSEPFLPIGERMNPSGRKKLSESIKKGDLSLLLQDAELQVQMGGRLLDLNVGVPLVDEPEMMKTAVVTVQNRIPTPLMIDSANTEALNRGASVYYGRPLLNSINAEDEKIHETIPVVRKHGAAIVAMTTGVMVPPTGEERLENAKKVFRALREQAGLQEEDVVFDVLGLVVSAMQESSRATLRTIELIKEYFPNAATTLGLSNVSFGLPNRSFVHSAFLAGAVTRGLDSAIMSVTEPIGPVLAAAADMWGRKPGTIDHFINNFASPIALHAPGNIKSNQPTEGRANGSQPGHPEPEFVSKLPNLEQQIFRGIVEGQKAKVEKSASEFAANHPERAMNLFMEVMTPAIRHLGDLFAARVKFIPHLIAAADSMKAGVSILEPLLVKARAASGGEKGTIIFATVKGDIHDIGKNICILMLRNFGFEVVDLGRNVDPEVILNTAIERKAQVVALSALMTTTMMQMKIVIDAVKERQLPFKVVIGGAVVTPDFATEIKADGYSTDVGTVVSEMERVLALLDATKTISGGGASEVKAQLSRSIDRGRPTYAT